MLTKDNTKATDVTIDHPQLTDRAFARNTSTAGHTERRKEEYNTNNQEKKKRLDSTKKLSDKNMKHIIDELKNKKDVSFLTKRKMEKEIIQDDISMNISNIQKEKNGSVKTHGRTDSMVKNADNSSSKLILSKINNNKHTRNCSFDKTKQQHTHNGHSANKNIHAMKDMVTQNNYKSNNNNHKLGPSQTLTPSMLSGKTSNITPNYIPTGNVLMNQNAVPCFNNINIYTSNMNKIYKTNEINLKQYIINKINKNQNKKHSRTASTNH